MSAPEAVWGNLDRSLPVGELAFRVETLLRPEGLDPENYHTLGMVREVGRSDWATARKLNRHINTLPDPRAH